MTPIPPGRLVDELVAHAAAGEPAPGIASGDKLMEGLTESDVEDNVKAVDAQARCVSEKKAVQTYVTQVLSISKANTKTHTCR